jgi:KDO2-lipid IV(A) lauroyltransferase
MFYWFARGWVALLQALPLPVVARIGRAGGAAAWGLDARHRRVALDNLRLCFADEMAPAEIRALARENFRRLGETYCCALKTAAMSDGAVRGILSVDGLEKLPRRQAGQSQPPGCVLAIGHFGNFELYARCGMFAPGGYRFATTYRALRQPALNRLMQSLREKSGCIFFERRTEGEALKAAMNAGGMFLGLLADQHAGDKGLRLPFLGHDCSTNAAPAVLALRYDCALLPAVCYRTGPGRWRVEIGDEIPTRQNGLARAVHDIMLDVNRAFEAAVRRDPANWFWVHRRWKTGKWKMPAAGSPGRGADERFRSAPTASAGARTGNRP